MIVTLNAAYARCGLVTATSTRDLSMISLDQFNSAGHECFVHALNPAANALPVPGGRRLKKESADTLLRSPRSRDLTAWQARGSVK